jgi:hypothetical protein
MRRALVAVAVVALSAGCQDQHQPLGPAPAPQLSVTTSTGGNPDVWILGRTYTLPDGTQCTFVGEAELFGTQCGDTYTSWVGNAFNTALYPVVEICRLGSTGTCLEGAANRAAFVRAPGEITVFNEESGKYRLKLDRDVAWWASQNETGTFRVIVAITYTGVRSAADGDFTPVASWDHTSDKVLGYYDFSRSGQGVHNVQFRIRKGALCEGNGSACVETSFDPTQPNTLIFDTEYELTDGEGIVGLQFPDLGSVLQQRVNIILERIYPAAGTRCITSDKFGGSGIAPGRELPPCYNIRTEPYLDLTLISPLPEPIRFGVCLEQEAQSVGHLLKMLKWSSVKDTVTDMQLSFGENQFFACPDSYDPNLAALPLESTSRLAAAGRMLRPLAALLRPQPAHASFRLTRSPANGSLMDFSRIVVQADEHYDAVYLSPIGASSSTRENLGAVAPTVGVTLCLKQGTGCAPASSSPPNHWSGTATWHSDGYYQVNWNTPRNQAPGTYLMTLRVRDYLIVAPDELNISFGTASFTHNPGRTLPIKFFLTHAQ